MNQLSIVENENLDPCVNQLFFLTPLTVPIEFQNIHTGPRCPMVMMSLAGPTVMTGQKKWSQQLREVKVNVIWSRHVCIKWDYIKSD